MKTSARITKEADNKSILHQIGLKATPTRIRLIEYLQSMVKPATVETIHAQLQATGIDKATIYRNLLALQKHGLVKQIDLHRGQLFFEWKHEHEDHHHLTCLRCGKIEDFTGCDFAELEKNALRQTTSFVRIVEHSIELFGICKACEQ